MLYDSIIIGAGPAGLTASIYASRYGLKNLVISVSPGGTASNAYLVENYPGCPPMTGNELMKKFLDQAKEYQAKIIYAEVTHIKKYKGIFEIKTKQNKTFKAKTVILALGKRHRTLSVPGEKEFLGRGVSYCFTCDGPFFRNKTVAVVGGGDSAMTSSLFLAKISKKVYLIHQKNKFDGQAAWQKKINQEKKIVKILNRQVKEIRGNKFVEDIVLDKPYQNRKDLKIDGLFIEIGSVPSGEKIIFDFPLKLKKVSLNYIIVGYSMETNVPGLFAAGDVTAPPGKLRQIITAAAEGAVAADGVQNFLTKKR